MAELGAVGNSVKAKYASSAVRLVQVIMQPERIRSLFANPVPVWLPLSGVELFSVDQTGSINGQVDGTAPVKAGTSVNLFATNGYKIDSKLTNTDGTFVFTGLDKTSTDYYIVAVAPGSYNAQVFSKLPPN